MAICLVLAPSIWFTHAKDALKDVYGTILINMETKDIVQKRSTIIHLQTVLT